MTLADDLLNEYATELPPDPTKYFGGKNDALLTATLADDVLAVGPLAIGVDNRDWKYHRGVWIPAPHVIRDRAVHLLGEKYRSSHARNIEDAIRARLRTDDTIITSSPISKHINFHNGLLDWHAGELHDHTPDTRSTVQLTIKWNPTATCPQFDAWLTQVVQADVIPLIWELIGYLMYSGNPLHKAVMLTGHGRNGKGTLLRILVAILGEHNITAVSLHDLINTRFRTAGLFGRIANIAGDIDAKYVENTATLKAITGEDVIQAEHKGRDPFDFTPWAVPVFSANKIPGSADVTVGYLSRWIVINFPNDFTGREDRTIEPKLHQELEGIAAVAIPALRRLMHRGNFELSASSERAHEDFRRGVDQVRTWIDECAELSPQHPDLINRTDVYAAYRRWAQRDGFKPVRSTEFYERIEAAGAELVRQSDGRYLRGVKILDHAHTTGTWL
jgi:putative DNA primase/helicase